MASVLNEAYFHDEAAAFEALEAILWPNGSTCLHCGATDRINRLEGVRSKSSKKHPKGIVWHGLWKCYRCRGQFTVRKGTVFEASHLKLHQWLKLPICFVPARRASAAISLRARSAVRSRRHGLRLVVSVRRWKMAALARLAVT